LGGSALRRLFARLAEGGLDADRFSLLALRMRRADAAIEAVVDAAARLAVASGGRRATIMIDAALLGSLPAEVALRLVGRALAQVGDEGPVELGKLEAFMAAPAPGSGPRVRGA